MSDQQVAPEPNAGGDDAQNAQAEGGPASPKKQGFFSNMKDKVKAATATEKIEKAKQDLKDLGASVKQKASNAADAVKEKAEAVRESATSTAADVKERGFSEVAKEKASEAAAAAKVSAAAAQVKISEVASDVKDKIEEKMDPRVLAKMGELQDKFKGIQDTLERGYEEKMAQVKQELNDRVEKMIDNLLDNKIKPAVKEGAVDPDMPQCVKNTVADSVDSLWPDIKEEVWNAYYDATSDWEPVPEGQRPPCCWNPCAKYRAWVLYTLYPFNKNIWNQIRWFSWWFFTLVKAIPVFGVSQIWFIKMWLLQDHDDEFRVVSFILELKGFQFLTVGLLSAIIAAIQYIQCVNLQNFLFAAGTPIGSTVVPEDALVHRCEMTGPGVAGGRYFYIEMGFFILQTMLVWIAFWRLPYTVKKGVRKPAPGGVERKHREPHPDDTKAVYDVNCCGCRTYAKRGGHLRHLIYYDLFVFLACVGLGIAGAFTRQYKIGGGDFLLWEWQFKGDLYWLRTLYGALSFPFALFALPGLSALLMHIRPTAYNKAGDCVPKVNARKEAKKQAGKKDSSASSGDRKNGQIEITVTPKTAL